MRSFILVCLCCAALALPAAAQQSRYSGGWGNPDRPAAGQPANPADAKTAKLLDELNGLVDEAERGRAADPRFLRDLRDLARRYAWPWPRLVIADDFADGDITRAPAWQSWGSGIRVDREHGVQICHVPGAAAQPAASQPSRRQDDLAAALIGGLLGQLARPDASRQPAAAPRQDSLEPGMKLGAAIPNRFALRVTLTSSTSGGGRLEIGLGKGQAALGYRIAYNAGTAPSFELLRVSGRGTAVIDATTKPVKLEDGKPHTIQLTRDAGGGMVFSLDGAELIRTRDRGLNGAFDGVLFINGSGDYTIRSVTVHGAG